MTLEQLQPDELRELKERYYNDKHPEARKREQVQRICAKLYAMSPDKLRKFMDFVREEQPDIYAAVFAEEYDK